MTTETEPQRTFRQRFGRSISLDRIENALRQAYRGSMRDITDLARETVDTDPHLASVLNKRFSALSGLPWEVHPADGPGVNPEKAKFYADVVREQLRAMEGFRSMLKQQAWALFDNRACNELHWIPVMGGMSGPGGVVTQAISAAGWVHPRRLSFGPSRELRVIDETYATIGGNFTATGFAVRDFPYKFVWWTPQLFGEYPEREGLAQRCMYWSFFKRFGARERMILLELFGKPWRVITVDEESSASKENLEEADAVIDALGGSFTARLPRGTGLNVVQPQKNAGQIHHEVIKESDQQMSKLVLGQTGTTDGVPAGLNSNQSAVMQDEQLMILHSDAHMMQENIETRVTDPIIAVNFGPGEVIHAPRFVLRSDKPSNRLAEIDRVKGALDVGLAIELGEAYEAAGFKMPSEGAIVIRTEQPPTPPNAPVAPPPRPVVVFPTGESPEAGEQQPPAKQASVEPGAADPSAQVGAADAAKTITVNEDRAARGLDPLTTPDGAPDPDGDLTIAEYEAKRATPKTPAPAPGTPPEAAESAPTEPDLADTVEVEVAARRLLSASDPVLQHNGRVLMAIVKGPSAEEVLDPYAGEGGIHAHGLDRMMKSTGVDGEHQHVFVLPDGRLMLTEFDGSHVHDLASEDADDIGTGGAHYHQIVIDGMTGQTDHASSEHGHVLQVYETGLDGPHGHSLRIKNPISGIENEIMSLTPGQFAAILHEMQRVEVVDPGAAPAAGAQASPTPDFPGSVPVNQIPPGAVRSSKRRRARRTKAARPQAGDQTDDESEPRRAFFATRPGSPRLPTDPRDIAAQAMAALARRGVDRDLSLALTEAVYSDEVFKLQWHFIKMPHDVCCAAGDDHRQPDGPYGSVETIVAGSQKVANRAVAKLVSRYKKAVKNRMTAADIDAALIATKSELDLKEVATSIERRILHGLVLGALDNFGETESETTGVSAVKLVGGDDVSKMRFDAALRYFLSKNVMTRDEFDRLSIEARKRAFTITGVLSDDLLNTIRAELARQIAAGADFREFSKAMTARLKSAGYLASAPTAGAPLSASHIETVYRTNVLNAYNSGRAAHQRATMKDRPVWEIRVVRDGGTRSTHRAVHMKRLRADDPFWQDAYPPFGFNCRCRVVSKGPEYLDKVVDGSSIRGLPDPGFASGISTLVR